MSSRTALYNEHLAAHAKIVDFAGWDMPLHYGSQIEEHHQVRRDAGMFDVSHMTIVDLTGDRVRAFLHLLLANNVDKLKPNQALYTCMLNALGGVIDDLIVYFMGEQWYRLVVNAATRDKDIAWISRYAKAFGVEVTERTELSMIAVQGPEARNKVCQVLDAATRAAAQSLSPFHAAQVGATFIGRTGYTGEDGFEILLPGTEAVTLWKALMEAGVKPVGLGARDTLRLEAGMNLYGADMDETTTPLESGLAWTVGWEPAVRAYIGRDVLTRQRAEGVKRKLVGLVLDDKGVLRNHQKVLVGGVGEGEITSGSFSPTLGCAIALARVPVGTADQVLVEIRDKQVSARVVKPPFVKNGRAMVG